MQISKTYNNKITTRPGTIQVFLYPSQVYNSLGGVPYHWTWREINNFLRQKTRWPNPQNEIWWQSPISNGEICLWDYKHTDIWFPIYHFNVNNRVTFIDFSEIIYHYFVYLSWPDVKSTESIKSSIKICSPYLFTLLSGILLSEFIPGPRHYRAGTLVTFYYLQLLLLNLPYTAITNTCSQAYYQTLLIESERL